MCQGQSSSTHCQPVAVDRAHRYHNQLHYHDAHALRIEASANTCHQHFPDLLVALPRSGLFCRSKFSAELLVPLPRAAASPILRITTCMIANNGPPALTITTHAICVDRVHAFHARVDFCGSQLALEYINTTSHSRTYGGPRSKFQLPLQQSHYTKKLNHKFTQM
ncbi:hypothetical protein M405DRAFT_188499 [Rhizopogon salebrosus TDB-379]|nr:hypothetical protein M405DRAFT_188499 [Rhizopogon salebrosus TDB-379]